MVVTVGTVMILMMRKETFYGKGKEIHVGHSS